MQRTALRITTGTLQGAVDVPPNHVLSRIVTPSALTNGTMKLSVRDTNDGSGSFLPVYKADATEFSLAVAVNASRSYPIDHSLTRGAGAVQINLSGGAGNEAANRDFVLVFTRES